MLHSHSRLPTSEYCAIPRENCLVVLTGVPTGVLERLAPKSGSTVQGKHSALDFFLLNIYSVFQPVSYYYWVTKHAREFNRIAKFRPSIYIEYHHTSVVDFLHMNGGAH